MPTQPLTATSSLPAGETVTPAVSWPVNIAQATLTFTSDNWIAGASIDVFVEAGDGTTFTQIGSMTILSGSFLDAGLPAITVTRQSALIVPGSRPPVFNPAGSAVQVRLRIRLSDPLRLGVTVTF